jgi:hypothetical protein
MRLQPTEIKVTVPAVSLRSPSVPSIQFPVAIISLLAKLTTASLLSQITLSKPFRRFAFPCFGSAIDLF